MGCFAPSKPSNKILPEPVRHISSAPARLNGLVGTSPPYSILETRLSDPGSNSQTVSKHDYPVYVCVNYNRNAFLFAQMTSVMSFERGRGTTPCLLSRTDFGNQSLSESKLMDLSLAQHSLQLSLQSRRKHRFGPRWAAAACFVFKFQILTVVGATVLTIPLIYWSLYS